MVIFLGRNRHWAKSIYDVVTAFLYGYLREKIYMKCPEGYELPEELLLTDEDVQYVLMLLKAIYGLVQAARAYYECFSSHLMSPECNFTRSRADPCLFYRGNHLGTVIKSIHVDDGFVIGDQAAIDDFYKCVENKFKVKINDDVKEFLG